MTHDPVKELDAVAAALSHDLRAPLRAIDGFSRILLSEERTAELPEELRRYLALVRDAGTELAELLDDLVDIVRIGRAVPAPRDGVDVARMAEELIEMVVGPRGDGVVWAVEAAAMPTCRADPTLLRRLLEELLDNAVKFGARRVEVGWDEGAGAYVVADDGIGVGAGAAELPAQAYEIFGRLHARDAYPGTGAGLAIARRIAALHGGRVWVTGREDGAAGARARFTLAS
jgi:two-component system sensor kinase